MEPTVILCIDDEPTVLDSLKEQLKRNLSNCTIETAESGEEALELLHDLSNDGIELAVAISDYVMPGMKGDEVLKQIHHRSPKTLTILLTGQASVQGVGNAVNDAQLYRFINKPWHEKDLSLTITTALRAFQQERQIEEKNKILREKNRQLLRLNSAYERFVPKEFLTALGRESIVDLQLGDQTHQHLTVLFSDIRSFTSLSETMNPQENFNFLNGFLRRLSPCIRNHNGFIDKFIGDAIMALFPRSPADAIRASVEMLSTLREYNQERTSKKRRPISIGVGLHTGDMMMGIIGEDQRLSSTVISDAVNQAARLERLTKLYGVSLIVSDFVLKSLPPDTFSTRFLGRAKVKGKQDAITIHEVLNGEREQDRALKEQNKHLFEMALEFYHRQEFAESTVYLNQVVATHPSDQAAQLYLSRARHFLQVGSPTGWGGIDAMIE